MVSFITKWTLKVLLNPGSTDETRTRTSSPRPSGSHTGDRPAEPQPSSSASSSSPCWTHSCLTQNQNQILTGSCWIQIRALLSSCSTRRNRSVLRNKNRGCAAPVGASGPPYSSYRCSEPAEPPNLSAEPPNRSAEPQHVCFLQSDLRMRLEGKPGGLRNRIRTWNMLSVWFRTSQEDFMSKLHNLKNIRTNKTWKYVGCKTENWFYSL